MSVSTASTRSVLPGWLVCLLSVGIAFHLLALLMAALAVPSGPWPGVEGSVMSTPPQFAHTLHQNVARPYLTQIKMTHSYHFHSNRPGPIVAQIEARLKDASGNVVETLRFPDPKANSWIRHRQALLGHWLTEDQVVTPAAEVIAAPDQEVPTVQIWDIDSPQHLKLATVPAHLVPHERTVYRPSALAMLLTRSYARYLRRTRAAASVEVIRHSQEALPPVVLFREDLQFPELISNFGELSK